MQVEDMKGKIIPGFGRCIYCGSDGGTEGLRDEHIMPFCLGGTAVIEKASCRNCEAITSRLDGYLGRRTFYELRVHTDIQTRRPKERPTHLPATLQVGGALETRMFPAKEQPFAVALPVWDKPEIIQNRDLTTEFPNEGRLFFYYVPPSLQAELPMGQFLIDAKSNTAVFARAIMKIAYCHAVAQLGLDGFEKLQSPQIVLAEYPYISHYVGCHIKEVPPLNPTLHMVQLSLVGREGGIKLWMQAIRLFAGMGFQQRGLPTYYAMVGTAKVA